MGKSEVSKFDLYMAKLRDAKDCATKERTIEQRRLVKNKNNGPSYNSLFGKKKA